MTVPPKRKAATPMEAAPVDLRIVAGSLRGRMVRALAHEGLRPTPQMVREALFSILGNAIPERTFYDVFAGTGVIGMEAISRGGAKTVFLEKDAKLLEAIQKYVVRYGIADKCQCLRADAYRFWERWRHSDEVPVNVFFSPPFPDLTERLDDFVKLIELVSEKVPNDSCVIIQAEDGFDIDKLPHNGQWDIRKYGRNILLFWVKDDPTPRTDASANPDAP